MLRCTQETAGNVMLHCVQATAGNVMYFVEGTAGNTYNVTLCCKNSR
jgi:hypothetical protein